MVEHASIREAKIDKQAAIIADANDLKAGSDVAVSPARRVQRDALEELREAESVDDVEAVALPSDRVDDEEEDDDAEQDTLDEADADEE